MRKSVVGFIFDYELGKLVLIEKNRPSYQKGLFNGLGGKLEEGEDSLTALVREVEEESGLIISADKWQEFGKFGELNTSDEGQDWEVDMFYTLLPLEFLEKAYTRTDEDVITINLYELYKYPMFNNTRSVILLLSEYLDNPTGYLSMKIK